MSKKVLRRMHSRPPCVKGAVKSAPKADLTGGLLGKMLRIFRNYMQLGNIFRTTPPSAYSADTSPYTGEALVRCKTIPFLTVSTAGAPLLRFRHNPLVPLRREPLGGVFLDGKGDFQLPFSFYLYYNGRATTEATGYENTDY